MTNSANAVLFNADRNRFELGTEPAVSIIEIFRPDERTLALTHTEVPPELEGQGVGSRLVKGALDYVRAHNLKILPYCPFVQTYLKRHPDYADVVAPGFAGK